MLYKGTIVYWEQSGFCLWLKRLEEGRFRWPTHLRDVGGGPVARSTNEQLRWLLSGLKLKHLKSQRASIV